jgi:FtsH-binding integral membrane protein
MDWGGVQWVAVAAGVVALFFGFKLLWVAVAAAGFAGALQLMPLVAFTEDWTDVTRWIVAGLAGLVLALAARALTRVGVRLVGFILAATFITPLLRDLEMVQDLGETGGLVISLVAGLVGAIVAGIAFKGAVIGLTAAWGGTAVLGPGLETWTAAWDPIWYLGAFAVLVLAGALYQYRSS